MLPLRLREDPDIAGAILGGYRGSIAHGTYVPQSDPDSIDDKDLMYVVIPPLSCYIGLDDYGSRGTREIVFDVSEGSHPVRYDVVAYELRKFIRLLIQGNPNVLSLLWLPEKHYVVMTDVGKMLVENRKLFVGRHVYRSFTGYAMSQFTRMTRFKFEGYMGEKRKALVEKYGWDCKNGAHLIRLMRMAIEFLTDGEMYVERPDAADLLAIKKGERTLEWVKEEANRLKILADEAYVRSSLPIGPDKEKINDLLMRMIRGQFGLFI